MKKFDNFSCKMVDSTGKMEHFSLKYSYYNTKEITSGEIAYAKLLRRSSC